MVFLASRKALISTSTRRLAAATRTSWALMAAYWGASRSAAARRCPGPPRSRLLCRRGRPLSPRGPGHPAPRLLVPAVRSRFPAASARPPADRVPCARAIVPQPAADLRHPDLGTRSPGPCPAEGKRYANNRMSSKRRNRGGRLARTGIGKLILTGTQRPRRTGCAKWQRSWSRSDAVGALDRFR